MNDAELDRMLSQSEPIVPSGTFATSVMQAIAREGTPSPLAFPWQRALPGFIGLAASLVTIVVFAVRAALGAGAAVPSPIVSIFAMTQSDAAGWILMALGVTLVSMLVPLRIARLGSHSL